MVPAAAPLSIRLPSIPIHSTQQEVFGTRSKPIPNQPLTPKEQLDLRILLVDNHDSYTYNLYQYLSTMSMHPVKVVLNDEFASWDELMLNVSSKKGEEISTSDYFDCIVISPGPGRPSHPADVGIVLDAIKRNPDVPILGVCLGHQALGYVYGCDVNLSPRGPVHGLMSSVFFDESSEGNCRLFDGIQQHFDVVRYHSLVVEFPDSEELGVEPIAWCSDEVSSLSNSSRDRSGDEQVTSVLDADSFICMGLKHKEYPHYGVQFHPESIGTAENGYKLIWNFCEFAFHYNQQRKLGSEIEPTKRKIIHRKNLRDLNSEHTLQSNVLSTSRYQVIIHKLGFGGLSPSPIPDHVFEEVYGSRHNSFWLDSSTGEIRLKANDVIRKHSDIRLDKDGCPITSNSRFSIMGSDDGPLSRKIEYFGREHSPEQRGLRVASSSANDGEVFELLDMSILTYLRNQLVEKRELNSRVKIASFASDSANWDIINATDDSVPFDFRGGYVGYLGYEIRYECLDDGCRGDHCLSFESEITNPQVPSAAFLFADRSLLYDHLLGDWYAIGVALDEEDSAQKTLSWIQSISTSMATLGQNKLMPGSDALIEKKNSKVSAAIEFTPNRSREQYVEDLTRSHEEIRKGESYELCVTNQLSAELNLTRLSAKRVHESPLDLYKRLRRRNPAPFSSFFNLFQKDSSLHALSAQVSICCSSPERFLSMRKAPNFEDTGDFVIESKPIKGTSARFTGPESTNKDQESATRLKHSVKDRAENLMIVDLLRNDFGRVCKVGSVHVPKLMHIESYATVHQMVSTVRGIVDGSTTNAIDVIEACFPGGSMTGAPKHRTVEILDEIEQGVSRGPYSGCLGYISLNGCMDMNIIIRTAVLTPFEARDDNSESWKVSIGCGGAITALSNSDDEYDEMLLKSRAVREAISEWAQSR